MTTTTASGPQSDRKSDPLPVPVTVLGLGAMGSAIARVLADRGHPLTVWNRTPGRADPLAAAGARVAATAAEAVAASPVVLLCVLDRPAVEEVLESVGDAIGGRVLINVTSGAPDHARAGQRWASAHDAQYLDGGIMADPPDLGSEHARFLYSGSREAFETHEEMLQALGVATYYGEDAGMASIEFLAQVAVGYEILMGLLHTLRLVRVEGGDPAGFAGRVADSLPSYGPVLRQIGQAVRDGHYPPDLGPLSVQAALMDDLVDHRESVGVDTVRMREVRSLMERRLADGFGHEGFSSLITLLDERPAGEPVG